jgi:hypothetical protein
MSKPPIGADVDQPLGVHAHVPTQFPFNLELPLDDPAKPIHLILSEVLDPDIRADVGLTQDPPRGRTPDAIDVRESHFQPFLTRKIYSCNPRHSSSSSLAA